MKKSIILVASLFIILIYPSSVKADSPLPPYIIGEMHLGLDSSPYVASAEGLSIQGNSKLIIDAGVQILFPKYSSLYAEKSELLTNGRSELPVVFKGYDGAEWGGIYLKSASSSLNSLRIEDAYDPIDMRDGKTSINDLYLDGNKNEKDQSYQYGVHGVNDILSVSSSTILNFKTAGIYTESGTTTLNWNTITNNGTGIQYKRYSPPVLVEESDLLKKTKSFLFGFLSKIAHAEYAQFPIIGQNNVIQDNTINAKNLSPEASIDLRNNYWGSKNGPGNTVIGNVLIEPWLNSPPLLDQIPKCCSSILFIPGFEATRLNQGTNQLWEPNRNADVEKLILNSSGQNIDTWITVGDVIERTNIGGGVFDRSIYSSFTAYLDNLVKEKIISEWQTSPYDWRLDLPIQSSISKIEEMAKRSLTEKVVLVGHSNGGLMAEKIIDFLKENNKENIIDKVILVATPEVGSPSSVSALLHGDDQSIAGGFILSQSTARDFGNNLAGAYNLIPSNKYFLNKDFSKIINFSTSTDLNFNLRNIYSQTISTFQSLRDFLLASLDNRSVPAKSDLRTPAVLNGFLLGKSVENHDLLDNQTDKDIKMYQIGAYGLPTTYGLEYYSKKPCSLTAGPICVPKVTLEHHNLKNAYGDGTVQILSALFHGIPSYALDINKYNKDNNKSFSHGDIMEVPVLQKLIQSIIENKTESQIPYFTFGVGGYPSVFVGENNISQVTRYGVHSPITLDGYDKYGNHTGTIKKRSSNSDLLFIEQNIPGSYYEEIGEDKYLYMANKDEDLSFEMKGTGSGTFNFDIVEDGGNIDSQKITTTFHDIPVIEGSIAKISVGNDEKDPLLMELDIDGDQKVDVIIEENVGLTLTDQINIFEKSIQKLDLPQNIKLKAKNAISHLRKLAKKDKEEEIKKKITNFFKILSEKKIGKKNMNQQQFLELIDLLSNTLHSLEGDI